MSTSPHQANSDHLKAEGNELFSKKDFTGVYQKYSQAIQHNAKNAVLYCNRTTCAFSLGRYGHVFDWLVMAFSFKFDFNTDLWFQVSRFDHQCYKGWSGLYPR